jgi:DNA-binding transcriptional LysR family regulator
VTLRHLEIFSAVCAQESFTRAAEQLNMAQPAVSLAIRELEVFYNVRLFERMNRRVYLTEAGRTLRQYADTVLSQFQESVEVLRESGAQGACRFGVHVTLGETRLAGILAHLAEALPEITVRASIHNVSTAALLACARAGLGITLLPRSLVVTDLERGDLRELAVEDGGFHRSYFLVRHRSKYLTDGMKRVIRVLREHLGGEQP